MSEIHALADIQSSNIGSSTRIWLYSFFLEGAVSDSNVMVGAGFVVTKDVLDSAVVVGNPARINRYLDK